jgi:membrane protease YdiL (CAAX protease family)
MDALAAVLATALAVLLVFVQPFAGRRRYQRLLARIEREPGARLHHYRRGIRGEWIGIGVVAVIGLLASRSAASIGLQWPDDWAFTLLLLAEVALLLVVSTAFMRRPQFRDALRRQARGFLALLPRTRDERWTFAVLAVTAGICEEILFRGFGFAYVRFLWPDASNTWVILITSLAFGLAHLYQGVRGVVLTGLAGIALASFTVSTSSFAAAIAAHAMIDLRILALPDLATLDVERQAAD